MNELGFLDYFIITIFLTGVTIQGLIVSGRQKSLRDYFIAGGHMPWWAVSISLYASLLTPMSFVGVTSWIYQKDSRWIIGNALFGVIAIPLAAKLWIPLWSRLRPLSIYEYLGRRFGQSLRTFGAIIFITQMIFWLGNELVTSSSAFEHVTRIPGLYCLLVIVGLNSLYTLVGGSRADIWTDISQFSVLLFAFLVIGVLLLHYFDWQPIRVYEIASSRRSAGTGQPHTRLFSSEFNLATEGTIWAIFFHRLNGVLAFGSEQVSVQRLISIHSRRHMYMALIGFTVLDLLVAAIMVLVSWGFVAFYQVNPAAQAPANPDQVLVSYAVNFSPVVIRGLVMAGVLAALMGSYGTGLNTISSVLINDYYRRFFAPSRSETHYLRASRAFTLITTIVLVLFAVWQLHHRELTAIQRMGQLSALVAGPMACLFMLGILFRRTNAPGAIVGGLAAIVFSLIFNGFPSVIKPMIEGVNWMWISGLSTATGLGVGYFASFLFAPPESDKLEGLTLRKPT